MKRFFLLLVFFACISIVASNALVDSSYFGEFPGIIISLAKQDPDPAEPGKNVEVSFKIDNNGTAAHNMVFEIVPQYPFSLPSEESSSKYVGTLGTSQGAKQSVIVKFKLKVAKDATDGSSEIKVRYKVDETDSWVVLENLKVRVQIHDAILAVEKFSTTPSVTAPGEKLKLRIVLKNYATSLLKDIKVSLNLDKAGDDKKPFAPIGSTNQKIISYIEQQSSADIEFELLVDSDAESKSYKIPLNIGYSDIQNGNYSKSNLVTLIVGGSPDLDITLERTDVYTSGSTGSVVMRLVNKGPVGIKFLNVKVLQNENLKVLGADEFYIGKLDSDDFSTAEFRLFASGLGSIKVPVEVAYSDPNNNNYRQNKSITLKLYTDSEAKNLGLKSSNGYLWIFLLVLIAIAAYIFYRRKRNRDGK